MDETVSALLQMRGAHRETKCIDTVSAGQSGQLPECDEVLPGGQVRIKGDFLWNQADATECLALAVRLTRDAYMSGGRSDAAAYGANECRLPGSVRSKQPIDLTRLYCQIETIEHAGLTVSYGKAFNLESRQVSRG